MHIQRIDVESLARLSGSFHFPDSGLALWAAPNEAGKSTLVSAVVSALYGPATTGPDAADPETGWVLLRFGLDDGTAFGLSRDLQTGEVQLSNHEGKDVTERFLDAGGKREVGHTIFGLTRDQFRAALLVGYDGLRSTVGNGTLTSLFPTGDDAAGSALPEPAFPPPPPLPPVGGEEELQIFRSAAEEMSYFPQEELPPLDIAIERQDVHADISGMTQPDDEPGVPTPPDPDEPGIHPVERVRRLSAQLGHVETRRIAARTELGTLGEQMRERQSEVERLSTLGGAEPEDVERLRGILDGMRGLQERKEELAQAESRYRRRLEQRGLSAATLRDLGERFGSLPVVELEFLRGYRQSETIRRGTRALTRSEQRLDDSRLQEIRESQDKAARLAVGPFVLAAIGLFGSLVLYLMQLPFVHPNAALSVGFAAAVAGGLLLWRARRLRDSERQRIHASQERKNAQMEELEVEDRSSGLRLEDFSRRWDLYGADSVLEQFELWEAHIEELKELEEFLIRANDLEHDANSLREKLGRFAVAEGNDAADVSLLDPDTMFQDYVRFFELRERAEREDQRSLELEANLAELELESSEVREQVDLMLSGAGIDPDRDLDEAIEVFALRAGSGGTIRSTAAAPPDRGPQARLLDETWTSRLSVRMEAILRRLMPEVRDVEIDGRLTPRLRFEAAGPALGMADLARRLSGAALDQVCLALRLAIMETHPPTGESLPVFLDDPLVRADDSRHDRALEFLVEDASTRGQVVLLTAQEVRVKWFLHQYPDHRDRITSIVQAGANENRESSVTSSSPASSPAS